MARRGDEGRWQGLVARAGGQDVGGKNLVQLPVPLGAPSDVENI